GLFAAVGGGAAKPLAAAARQPGSQPAACERRRAARGDVRLFRPGLAAPCPAGGDTVGETARFGVGAGAPPPGRSRRTGGQGAETAPRPVSNGMGERRARRGGAAAVEESANGYNTCPSEVR